MFWTSVHGFFPDLSRAFNLVRAIAGKMCILGFHMTSPKFKLRNYRFFWVSEFHEVFQHLNTFIYTKFWFERVLRFAIEDVWISMLLRDAAFSWRPGRLLCGLKTLPIWEILLSKHSLPQNKYDFNPLWTFKRWIHALVRKLKNRCLLVSGGHICAPQTNTNTASPYKTLLNLGKTFFRISRIWNIAQTWFLARPFAYLSSFIS